MPQEIYNEGRVVGLSAWELYVKQALGNGVPLEDIPDEHEWLASMIGSGASVILRIPVNTTAGIHEYELPANSDLSAAGVIVASPFIGECAWDSSTWATKVISYGALIKNTSGEGNYPTSSNVPYSDSYPTSEYANCVSEFVKITDGIVYTKNATWVDTQDGTPYKDIDPNFNESSTVVRLYINTDIKYEVRVLLTGFHNKRILQGISGYATGTIGGSCDTNNNNWVNGGMLGPEIIPWASKIIFTVPSSYYNLANALTRTIPSDTAYTAKTVGGIEFRNVTSTVKASSVIDLNSINVTDYYTVHASEFASTPTLTENVTEAAMGINESYNTLTAWYPGMTAAKIDAATDNSQIFPPALYATQITSTGSKTLVPVDTAAPGTVKGFSNATQATNYTNLMRDNFAMYYDTATNTYNFVAYGKNPSGTAKIDYLTAPKAKISAGGKYANFVALNSYNSATQTYTDYNTAGTSGITAVGPANNLTWDAMLSALVAGNAIDVLGTELHAVGNELKSNSKSIGTTYTVNNVKTAKVTVSDIEMTKDGNNVALASGKSLKSGTQYIEFADGKRLYISGTAPTGNIPVGSIGIGW